MNKRLFDVMLALCLIFLIISYIIQIFLPDYFVITFNSTNFLKLMVFINSHTLIKLILSCITSFITYYIFICACAKLSHIHAKGCIIIIFIVVIGQYMYNYTGFGIHYGVSSMLILAAVFNANLKDTAFIYTIHGLGQILCLNIHRLPILVDQYAFGQTLTLLIDTYIWLILMWVIQLQNKEVGIWEQVALHITEMKSKMKLNLLKKKSKKQSL